MRRRDRDVRRVINGVIHRNCADAECRQWLVEKAGYYFSLRNGKRQAHAYCKQCEIHKVNMRRLRAKERNEDNHA